MDLTEKSSAEPWNLPRRLAFRFAFAYWLLLCLPFPLDVIPGFESVSELYRAGENRFVPWVAAHILHLPEPIEAARNGSGDTTFRWVQLLCVFSLAVIVAALWSLLDRKRRAYPWLDDSLRVYVRFFLLSLLWVYGMDKVIQVQFPVPGPSRMLQTYGESSPMGLLWTFMGSSTAYTAFSGAMEVLGGFLLFFRRTTSLGALVAAGVMTNVVALNFCYDVPVKILSSHLLLAAIYLLAPDLGRLFKVLVSNRPTAVRNLAPPPLRWRWLRIARALVWLAFCVSTATFAIRGSLNAHREAQKKPAIYGTYQVAEFIRNGETPPPLLTDQALWRLVTFENGGLVIHGSHGGIFLLAEFFLGHDLLRDSGSLFPRTNSQVLRGSDYRA